MPEHAKGKPLEVWFQDEARVGQQGTLTRKWARRGTRPRAPRDTRYKWSYIFGAACPARGTAAGLIVPYVNAEAMGLHLNEIAKAVAHGAHAMLIVDGAGWHGAKCLQVPDNITLVKLPPYSPELNPMENVWAYLRSNKLAISVFDTYEEILEKCAQAWNFFANDPQRITSITKRDWIKVNYGPVPTPTMQAIQFERPRKNQPRNTTVINFCGHSAGSQKSRSSSLTALVRLSAPNRLWFRSVSC